MIDIDIDEFEMMDGEEQGDFLAEILSDELGIELDWLGFQNRNEFLFDSPDIDTSIHSIQELQEKGWPIYYDPEENLIVLAPFKGMPSSFWNNDSIGHSFESVNPSRARRLFERDWKIAFKIGDVWSQAEELDTEDEDDFDQFKSLIMPKIRKFFTKMETFLEDDEEIMRLDDIIMDLDNSDDAQEWDYSWEDFYDWADDNEVWIETHDSPDDDGPYEEKVE